MWLQPKRKNQWECIKNILSSSAQSFYGEKWTALNKLNTGYSIERIIFNNFINTNLFIYLLLSCNDEDFLPL